MITIVMLYTMFMNWWNGGLFLDDIDLMIMGMGFLFDLATAALTIAAYLFLVGL